MEKAIDNDGPRGELIGTTNDAHSVRYTINVVIDHDDARQEFSIAEDGID